MPTTANLLYRDPIKKLVPYASARRIGGHGSVWINANESPGSHCRKCALTDLNRYPDFQPEPLLTAYSQFCGLPAENILITRGADEGIELLIRTFCAPEQDKITFCPPTYGMYAISAETCGVHCQTLIESPLDLSSLPGRLDPASRLLFLKKPRPAQ